MNIRSMALLAAMLGSLVLMTATFAADPPATKQTGPATGEAKPAVEEPIDFEKARALFAKFRAGEKLSPEERAYVERARAARAANPRGGQPGRPAVAGGKASFGFKPISDMTADDRYKDQEGGLYGDGKNEPSGELAKAAAAATQQVVPRAADGKPSPNGTIGLISISMSNATQEFSTFKQLADADKAKSSLVTVVDCAQGGQAMAEWVDPKARPWAEALRRLEVAGVSPLQVQVAWVKIANKSPRGELSEHGKQLEEDTLAVVRNAREKFPNLKVVYLSSRIYGGWSGGSLNPEPYAYEGGFVARWLVQGQLKEGNKLNADEAPIMLWGPYLWADGETARASDGLSYPRSDLSGDGTHPSTAGRAKVAEQLLQFFKKNELAASWFVGKS